MAGEKLALTTNDYRLAARARDWFDVSIRGLKVNLDSLAPDRFHRSSRHDCCDEVWHGINTALEAGFEQVNINVVYMKGINDARLMLIIG